MAQKQVQVCLICFNKFNSCVPGDNWNRDTEKETDFLYKDFLQFLEQHLRIPLNFKTFLPLQKIGCDARTTKSVLCSECREFVNTICGLFQEMCKIQVKLAFKLGKLAEMLENSFEGKNVGDKRESGLFSTLASQLSCDLGDDDDAGGNNVTSRQILEMKILLGHYCKLEAFKHVNSAHTNVNPTNRKTSTVQTRRQRARCYPSSVNEDDNDAVEQGVVVKEEAFDIETDDDDGGVPVDIQSDFENTSDAFVDASPGQSEEDGSEDDNDDTRDNERVGDENGGISPETLSSSECDDSDGSDGWSPNCSKGRGRPTRNKRRRPSNRVEMDKTPASSGPKLKSYIMPKPRLAAEKLDVYANEVWRCQYCEKTLRGGTSLVNHLRNNHEKEDAEKLYPCYLCYRTYSLEQSRAVHLKLFHWKQKLVFSCEDREGPCESPSFQNMEELYVHLQNIHKGQPLHCCTKCNWPFLTQNRRLLHEIFHTEIISGSKRRYLCPMDGCTAYAESPKKLASHYSSKHDIQEVTLTCPTCKKGFSNEHSLSRHRRMHFIKETTGQEYKCPHCPKLNSCQQQLESHVNLKHTLKTCPDCGIQMYYDSYRRHIYKKHGKGTRGTVYLCQECGKECVNRYDLRKHMEIKHHPDGKNRPPEFVCSECGKSYYGKVALEVHMKMGHMSAEEKAKLPVVIGKGKWNSKCLKCGKVFRWESDVMLHLVMKRSCSNYVMKKARVGTKSEKIESPEEVATMDNTGNEGIPCGDPDRDMNIDIGNL